MKIELYAVYVVFEFVTMKSDKGFYTISMMCTYYPFKMRRVHLQDMRMTDPPRKLMFFFEILIFIF